MLSWWHRDVIAAGKLPLMLCFVSFVVTFVSTRTITRRTRRPARNRRPARLRRRPGPRTADRIAHMPAMSLATRSSAERNGSLHSTVR
jgi:hypothetical protein